MTKNDKLVDAVRVVGQLLLHRPTTNVLATNRAGREVDVNSPEACRFCYNGAIRFVSRKLHMTFSTLDRQCDDIVAGPGSFVDGYDWDCATSKQRKAWATKLANFEG